MICPPSRKLIQALEPPGLFVCPRSPRRSSCCDAQAKHDEEGQVQAEEHNLVSGGLLSMISPVSDTFK